MDNVLITGNLGYNGVWVTKTLRNAGYHTIGFDSNYYEHNFFDCTECLPDAQITKDIRRIEESDLEGINAIVHLAALSNDATGELNPELTFKINRDATIQLARLAKKQTVRKFIFASSCSVYGISDCATCVDEESVLQPLTAYAKAKTQAESELVKLHDTSFAVVIMRNATMHGPSCKLRLDLVVNNLVAYAYIYNKVKILSDGTPWRPLLSVADFAQAVLLLLKNEANHIIYNVGANTENYQIRTLAQIVREITGAELEINKDKTPDERSYKVDFSRFENEFPDFRVKMPVRESVIELIKAYRKCGLTEGDFLGPKYFRIRTLKDLLAQGTINGNLEKPSCPMLIERTGVCCKTRWKSPV